MFYNQTNQNNNTLHACIAYMALHGCNYPDNVQSNDLKLYYVISLFSGQKNINIIYQEKAIALQFPEIVVRVWIRLVRYYESIQSDRSLQRSRIDE